MVSISAITNVDLDRVEQGVVVITADGIQHTLEENDAIEAVMLTKPSALEGKRLKWAKNAWMLHNLVGHPLMQLLASTGFYGAAIAIHDHTVPRPIGFKNRKP